MSSRERVISKNFPQKYLEEPVKWQELTSKVSGAVVSRVANEFPRYMLKAGTACELRSKFTLPPPAVYPFFKTYGGAGGDFLWATTRTMDGNYLVGGHTTSFPPGTRPILLIKIDNYGEVIWSKTYGGGGTEFIRTIEPDPYGGYILSGFTTSAGIGGRDMLLMHINENGGIDWVRAIGSTADDELRGAYRTPDGGIMMAGFTSSFGTPTPQPIVVKLDYNFNIEFAYVYNFEYPTVFWGLAPTWDGGYVATGRDARDIEPTYTGIVAKIGRSGNLVWARRIYSDCSIRLFYTEQISSDEYVAAGDIWLGGEPSIDMLFVKMKESGEIVKSINVGTRKEDYVTKIRLSEDGYIIGAGISDGVEPETVPVTREVLICKLDKDLNTFSCSALGGIFIYDAYEESRDVISTYDGGYMLVGHTPRYGYRGYDGVVIKTDKNLLIDNCPIFRPVQMEVGIVQTLIQELYPTVIDVKNNLVMVAPTFTSYDVGLMVTDGCISRGWDIFMEERH